MKKIKLVFDNKTLSEYEQHYFSIHKKAKKRPIPHPYHESTVTLSPIETVDLSGKYIYQIIIRDIDGDVEIPKQGILYITNNINKNFIRQ